MANSVFAVFGSSVIWETPPKMKRVMLRTGISLDRAYTEWASSCRSTETKRSRLVARPTTQVRLVGQL